MKLSLIIPAHNEEDCIASTIRGIYEALTPEGIEYEILVINDNSTDRTIEILNALQQPIPQLRHIDNHLPNGFGFAVRCGLENFQGDAVVIVMADASDPPADIIRFYRELEKGYDCVFGTRFSQGGQVIDYPIVKLILNRLANLFIRIIFQFRYNDTTNAFKMYRAEVVEGLKPFLSHHFNLTVELPLKCIIRKYSYSVIPNTWVNRAAGVSKLRVREMGSRYLFIVLYCWLEKWLSRGDYIDSKNRPRLK